MIKKTGERVIPENFKSREEYLIYLRHKFVYKLVEKKYIPFGRVLEVGSGEGYGASILAKSEKVDEIIGIDVDLNSTDLAFKKYKSDNLDFQHFDGVKIPFEDKTFECVVSFQVIEHIHEDENYISEIFRVLKNGGVFILTTPNRIHRLKLRQKPWNRFHVREYSFDSLKKVLNQKFKDVKIFGVKGDDDIQKIETERIKKIQKIISLDFLNLRSLIPEFIKLFIIKFLKILMFKRSKDDDFLLKYNVRQYYITEDEFDDSLDILAICKKNNF